jgi:hypothetical protein
MSFKDSDAREKLRIKVERDITPGLGAVDRAIAFIRTRGTATSSELHIVMELEPDELPSKHLAEAIADKRIVRVGWDWSLGAAALLPGGLIDVVEVEAA